MGQCTAKSKRSGERCKNFCSAGKTVCRFHGGKSNGAPKKNKNNLKHGAYESISEQTMTPEEIEYAKNISLDQLATLREQLRVLRVKEARIAKRMKKAMDCEANVGKEDADGKKISSMVTLSATQVVSKNQEGAQDTSVSTASETHEMHYLRLEQVHTGILGQIRRTLDHIHRIELESVDETMSNEPITFRVVDARVKSDE
jgi:phage terminase small subunit